MCPPQKLNINPKLFPTQIRVDIDEFIADCDVGRRSIFLVGFRIWEGMLSRVATKWLVNHKDDTLTLDARCVEYLRQTAAQPLGVEACDLCGCRFAAIIFDGKSGGPESRINAK